MNKIWKNELIFPVIFVLTISVIITAILSSAASYIIKRDFANYTRREIIQVDNMVNTYFSVLMENCKQLATNADVKKADENIRSYVNQKTKEGKIKFSPLMDDSVESRIFNVYKNFATSHTNIADVYMATKYGGYIQYRDGNIYDNYDPRQRPWYKIALETPGKVTLTNAYYWEGADAANISIVSTITNNSNEIIGVQAIDISLKELTDMIKNIKISDTGYIILAQDDGVILSNPKNAELNFEHISKLNINKLNTSKDSYFEFKENNKKYIANIYTSKKTGWKFIGVMERSELYEKMYYITLIIFIVTVAIVTVFLLIVRATTENKLLRLNPIFNLEDK
ncbi:cache domain [Gottschalkia purinilytica]|uniref:Cache domain n=1 Tax=Gottschalkia purinilytica TaxID=1503 RepID=A0A0L0W6Z1_GOTPU|nr:cache domain-containing protein [Gottschalkia purinilytica]KNF07030.1 cache domain [Gottschalkia purinilytica]